MKNQHWQTEDVLIAHLITNIYVNEAFLSANGSTDFLDMGCGDCSPSHFLIKQAGPLLGCKHLDHSEWCSLGAVLWERNPSSSLIG